MNDILFLDIETLGNPDMVQFIPEPKVVVRDDKPKSYKTEKAISDWMATETARREEKYNEAVEKMALDVDYARVVAIGYARDDGEIFVPVAMEPETEDQLPCIEEEAHLLRGFWILAQQCHRICGWNVLNFDLPIILRRSWVLGVQPTRMLDFRRYSTSSVIDLMQLLYNWGQAPGPRYRGLKAVAKMYGVKNELPDLGGSQVAEMDEEALVAYCANDVRMTRELAQKTKGWYWK